MKLLFIGGSGNISAACSRLALSRKLDLYILNRGIRQRTGLEKATQIQVDLNNIESTRSLLKEHHFDVVVNFIAFTPEDMERDLTLFSGKCGQYIFISSASAYQSPPSTPFITESTPLSNPYWDYSRDKIACEEMLTRAYRDHGFPMTIVRPSHTYDTVIPVAVGSWEDYTIIERMRKGKKIVIHGDGTSLWTLTHSDDFARGFTGLLGNQQAIGHSFHITSDEVLNWNQIYQAVADAAGVELKAIHVPSDFICQEADKLGMQWMRGNLLGDKSSSVIFDNSKIKGIVPDYVASIPFKQGIKRTINWFDADPDRVVIDPANNRLLDNILKAYNG